MNDFSRTPSTLVYGRNAVREALKTGRAIDKIYLAADAETGSMPVILAMAREQRIPVKKISRGDLTKLCQDAGHQGIAAVCAAHAYVTVEDILEKAREKGEDPFLVVCETIQDPHNLGAIIRTAEAAGAHGVIVSTHYAVGLTEAVAKTAEGALEYMPVARVSSIANLISELKQQGIWTACADMDGTSIYQADLTGPLALVIGGEHDGITPLVKKRCDFSVSIPMKGKGESLNASVAAGILMYEIAHQRDERS